MLTYLLLIITKQNKKKTRKGRDCKNICCKCLIRNANSCKIQGPNKRQQRVLSSSELSETWEKETALAAERHSTRKTHASAPWRMELALQTEDSKFFSPSSSRICFGWHPAQEIQLMSPAQASTAVIHCSRQKQIWKAGRQLSNLGTGEGDHAELLPGAAALRLASYCFLHPRLLPCHLPDSQLVLSFFVSSIRAEWQVTVQTHADQNRCKK